MDIKINMFSTEELAQMLEIRKQMDHLQHRYDAIVKAAHARLAAAPGGAAAPAPKPDTPGREEPRPAIPQAAAPAPAPAKSDAAGAGASKTEPERPAAPSAPALKGSPAAEAKGGSLKDAVVAVLKAADAPLDFETVFQKLEEAGAPLPEEKPKLVLRRILYDKNAFDIVKGRFTAR
jgi:hypothetical protein